MKATLPEFERAGVMVVGDAMLNRYWYSPTSHISPEAPIPVIRMNTIEERPDSATDVAMNTASLGANTRLVRLTGIDDTVRALSKSLADVSVKYNFVPVPAHPTITKLRVLSCNQQPIHLNFEEGFEGVGLQPLRERIDQALSSIGALVLSGYAKGALTSVQQMIQLVRKAGVPVLINPEGTDFKRYRGATLLTPNLSELETVVGRCKTEEEIVEHDMKLIADYELSALLVTRSEQSMSLLQPGKTPLHMPTQAREACNVIGTGDTVIGILVATLAAGSPLEEAYSFANATTGVMVDKLGTSTVSPIELEDTVREHTDTNFDVMTEEKLKLAVAAAHKRDEKVVMTNGILDILHARHVSYLANARRLDDRLIVAVNSDTSTKRLKGDSHPVNPLEQCMIVLNVLEAVDWVVSFEEDTPQRLVTGILPNLLVKGGGYRPEEVIRSKKVWANGDEVLVLNFEDDCLTTNIIRKIQQDKRG